MEIEKGVAIVTEGKASLGSAVAEPLANDGGKPVLILSIDRHGTVADLAVNAAMDAVLPEADGLYGKTGIRISHPRIEAASKAIHKTGTA
jgi:hypothetical protein